MQTSSVGWFVILACLAGGFAALMPLLALLQLAHVHFRLERKKAVVIAWIVSALVFGAAHLPTYDWNLIQCFGIIGVARLEPLELHDPRLQAPPPMHGRLEARGGTLMRIAVVDGQ